MFPAIVKEPIYHQLNSHLRRLITSGAYPVGAKFLTERQICEKFGISRATANKALSNLVSEGLLEFRKGVGTFVKARALDYNLHALVSFTEEAIAAGKHPSTRVLHFSKVSPRNVLDEVPQLLQVGPDSLLYYVERLRLADDVPVILERRYIVAEYCPDLTRADLAKSLYRVWTDRYQLSIEGADERIRAVNLRGAEARALRVRDGAAGLLISSVGYLTGGKPLWTERTLYRGDAYEFHSRLGGIQPARYAQGRFLETERGSV
ncbi:MAG TPA: GntR family transcriptional regulator [Bryobacteraceae bacterium]|nr:GntR family transcriptional regulator [Bryobacteraceae bacterium]HOL71907.1 GntR family transcriptional regulator [Bryobacteraceae bacterium]HOQ44098.1 GntR family transcriptional regulator [Bryobacteraceae bacterium]HPQ15564.1 GntR family transcriptional regulator [Bryobacteraceae bacterium]HPU70416.1 GntR family transcriptional regulator [Bryobacteraceae bacterium]